MRRLVLVAWNRAEAPPRAAALRRAGHAVEIVAPWGTPGLRGVIEHPPDAVIVDLTRLPSDGRDVAVLLRQRTATRRVPLVFAGGDPGKVARTRALLPAAVYAQWSRIRGAVRDAIAHAPATPVVRGTMDAYAGAPLPKKLGIRSGALIVLLGAPREFERTLGLLPDGARGDLTQPVVRAAGIRAGLVDYTIASFDETWSGLRFARRARGRSGATSPALAQS